MRISLSDRVTDHLRLTALQKTALKKLGIATIYDLLHHFPVRYGDSAETRTIDSLEKGEDAVIYGKINSLKTGKAFRKGTPMAEGVIEDETGRIRCVWFNQPYIAKMIPEGALVRIEGRVSQRKSAANDDSASPNVSASGRQGNKYFTNPKIEAVTKMPEGVGESLFGAGGEAHSLYPVYPESRGITSSWLYHNIAKIFRSGILDQIEDPIPPDILAKYHLPAKKTALVWIHSPQKRDDAVSARKRFSFEEIFLIQINRQQARSTYESKPSFGIRPDERMVSEFVKRFPFRATTAQESSIETIISDMSSGRAMLRLLEGDVGSGKTAVAAATVYAIVTAQESFELNGQESKEASGRQLEASGRQLLLERTASRPAGRAPHSPSPSLGPKVVQEEFPSPTLKATANNQPPNNHGRQLNLQVAYMCPTEILAAQHFESFISYFSYLGVQVGLITSSGCRKFPSKVNPKGWTDISRNQLLKWVENGEIPILIGTHALIEKGVKFKRLAYVIIDEQHRFGTAARAALARKNGPGGPVPHLLSMTATPIPRTLALTMYGDLDLSLLDQPPAGRKPVLTEIVRPEDRDETYEKIRRELADGRQAYVICPRIDEPDPDKELALYARSVKAESERLKKYVFPEYEIGILHGRMKPAEKDKVMEMFKNGDIDILCATSVVEVGVNVPNATVIAIEGAERFGLSQLHQLRGRVMRSSMQAYCYVFTETDSPKSLERLKALRSAKNGFELSELDLSARGAGRLQGGKQWGVSDIAMEALKNIKMVEAARTEAQRLIAEDPSLSAYPELKSAVSDREATHLE